MRRHTTKLTETLSRLTWVTACIFAGLTSDALTETEPQANWCAQGSVAAPWPVDSELEARAIEFVDGDSGWLTIHTRNGDKRRCEFRLWGIDAPEAMTSYGPFAHAAAQAMVSTTVGADEDPTGKYLSMKAIVQERRMSYDRIVILLEHRRSGAVVNAELVEQGHAINCQRYSNGEYAQEQIRAERNLNGFWGWDDPRIAADLDDLESGCTQRR